MGVSMKRFNAAKKRALKGHAATERVYLDFVRDAKERHEAGIGEAPDSPTASDDELKAKYPGLDGIPKHHGAMAATGKQEFVATPDEAPVGFQESEEGPQ